MATLLAMYDLEDVDHWLSSPKREELFGPMGITVRIFRGEEGLLRTGGRPGDWRHSG